MHRSGTSLVTRALQALGVPLGENLSNEASPDNAKGHWEDRDVLAFNERLMAALALEWDLIGEGDDALMAAPSLDPLVDEARSLVLSKFAGNECWAFKDPRTARLWPFWRRVFSGDGLAQPHFVWVIRHPQPVALSLAGRNNFDPVKSHLLWLHHNIIPFDDITAAPHVVVDYDQMLSQPRPELQRIVEAMQLTVTDKSSVDEFVAGFLDTNLRHFVPDENRNEAAGPELVSERAYRMLLELARGATSAADPQWLGEWQDIRRETAAFAAAASRVDASTVAAQSLDRVRQGIVEELGRQQQHQTTRLQQQVTKTLQDQFVETSNRIVDAETRLAEVQKQRQEEHSTELQRQFEAGLQAQFAETTRRINQVQSQLQSVEADHARARADLATANQLLNRERYTVLKPLLRKAWRLGVETAERLPAGFERQLRRLKRMLMSRSMPLTVTIDTPPDQAVASAPEPAEAEDEAASFQFSDRLPGFCDILIFPVIDWNYRFQRPQQLARQLALRGHRIFYLSTTFEASEAPGFSVLESPEPNVVLLQLALPGRHPNIYQDLLTQSQRVLLSSALYQLLDKERLDNLVAIVDLPFWRPLVETVPGCLMVYDCMDYHAGFSTNSPGMIEEETRLLKRADIVVTSSAPLSEIVGATTPNLLIRNAGDIEYFSRSPAIPAYKSERPVAGYLGAIADWFDIELVVASAQRFTHWDFVLVGSTDHCDTQEAQKLTNIKFVGEVPYDEASGYVHSFDVAMIPFLLTELTRCTNPVKVYEYLAAGKPVVTTALPELQLMSEVVHVADSREAFMDLLEAAMAERDDAELATRRAQSARPHAWANRCERLERAIRSAFPKVSVIVLTFNNLDFTKACLKSLEINTCHPDWELVLVDNASTDGSRDYLAEYAVDKPWVKLIQNEENLGFAAGNNRGLESATGEYVVILNNDTYVTRGWLPTLVRHLQKDPKLGLIGAVTNNIGNEAKIDIHYEDMAEMHEAAFAYTARHAREELEVDVVAFFCTALPRAVFESIGGLDERFGLGFFEDDDYCRRIAAEGYRIAVAEDVFIHHHLSASFDQIDDEERQALFERNKALYEEKWGTWTPHRYRNQ